MSVLTNAKDGISKAAGNAGLILRKNAPTIMTVGGIVGGVTATIFACKATIKAQEVLEDSMKDISDLKEAKEEEVEGAGKELAKVYLKTGLELAKLYGPSIIIGGASIYSVMAAHGVMRRRNASAIAAYSTVAGTLAKYRERVVESLGEEKDLEFLHGIKTEKVDGEIIDEKTGKRKKIKEEVKVIDISDGYQPSQYAKFFDDSCAEWTREPEYNMSYILAQQAHANDMLKSRGHIFLNEVYDMLGMPRTKAGAIVGWVWDKPGEGDGFVDFNIFNVRRQENRDFVNGYESCILLDFNVDGVIYDLI